MKRLSRLWLRFSLLCLFNPFHVNRSPFPINSSPASSRNPGVCYRIYELACASLCTSIYNNIYIDMCVCKEKYITCIYIYIIYIYKYIYIWGEVRDLMTSHPTLSARNLNGTVEFHGALDIRTTVNPHDHWKSGSAIQILRPRCSLAANCWEGIDVAPTLAITFWCSKTTLPNI